MESADQIGKDGENAACQDVLLHLPVDFPSFTSFALTIFFTVVGAILGVAGCAVVRSVASQRIRLFRIVTIVGLILSFLSDVRTLTDAAGKTFRGATVSRIGTLMVHEVVAAAVVVWMLTTRIRSPVSVLMSYGRRPGTQIQCDG